MILRIMSIVPKSNVRSFHKTCAIFAKQPDPGITLEEKKYVTAYHSVKKGAIGGKLPIKVKIVKGKTYHWCACGYSHDQPLCNMTHQYKTFNTPLKPLIFKAPETKEVWLCTCKQTNNPPFCDGSHRKPEVQDGTTTH